MPIRSWHVAGSTGGSRCQYDRAVFSQRERRDLRECLAAAARVDERIRAAAVVGSAAVHGEDEWSGIDLAFRLAAGLKPADVGEAWTVRMYDDRGAVDHLNVGWEHALSRVSALQLDAGRSLVLAVGDVCWSGP